MNKLQWIGLAALCVAGLVIGSPALAGDDGDAAVVFQVTVTNLTRSQPLSPIALATHRASVSMFTPGEMASSELALMAEEGDNSQLLALLGGRAGVREVVGGAAPIGPGGSDTFMIRATNSARFLSLAGMLVNTNDAFLGVDSFELSRTGSMTIYGVAFDAGSEFNSEACAYIPGPACGNAAHDPTPAEGYIYVSNGIQGIGDLESELYDWHNPVARIEITRIP